MMKKTALLSILGIFVLPAASWAQPEDEANNAPEPQMQQPPVQEMQQPPMQQMQQTVIPQGCCYDYCCPVVCCPDPCDPCCLPNWSLEFRASAFIPLTKQLRHIYKHALPSIGLEGAYNIFNFCDCWPQQLLLWWNVSWVFQRHGRTIDFGYCSKLDLLPVSIGAEYQISLGCGFDFYVGLGGSWSWLWIKNNDGFSRTHIDRNHVGLVTKTGFRYTFWTNYFIDVFGDYYWTRFKKLHDSIQHIDNNFSAFFVGGGVGIKF